MTLSTKPEVHKFLHYRQRTELRPQKIWWNLDAWFLRYAIGQTNKHTDALIAILCTHVGGEVITDGHRNDGKTWHHQTVELVEEIWKQAISINANEVVCLFHSSLLLKTEVHGREVTLISFVCDREAEHRPESNQGHHRESWWEHKDCAANQRLACADRQLAARR